MAPARIWVFRHAESMANAGHRTPTPAAIDLSPEGYAQAEALALTIGERPDRLVASPYVRSRHTLAPIARKYPGIELEIWPIHEFTYLAPATCVNTSWQERKPRIDHYWRCLLPESVDGPGAESFEALMERADAFLNRIAAIDDGFTIVASHGHFMLAVSMLLEEGPKASDAAMARFHERDRQFGFENCGCLRLIAEDGRVSIDR
jgi:2,3-bisphosphoglycerate-dependent phosphoglycerate mutase